MSQASTLRGALRCYAQPYTSELVLVDPSMNRWEVKVGSYLGYTGYSHLVSRGLQSPLSEIHEA